MIGILTADNVVCAGAIGPEALAFIAPPDGSPGGPNAPGVKEMKERAEATNGAMKHSIVNWREVIDAADEQGCEGYIIERERAYNIPPEINQCLREDLEYIRSIL